jgi:hypothetical protein
LAQSRRVAGLVAVLVVVGLAGVFLYACGTRSGQPGPTPTVVSPVAQTTPLAIARPTRVPTTSPAPDPSPAEAQATQTQTIYLPWVTNGGGISLAATETSVATPTSVPVPSPPTPTPTPTRGPIRITKLGLGVYESGGAMLPILDDARPSVILLMDPSIDFAKEVRQRFPKAFIVGRIFAGSQPLDNPGPRGTAFADQVAATAVPLKGVVDAWMSYNEVANGDDPANMIAYNTFQVAFAHRLQDYYGIPAVAGNDGPRAVRADEYPKYFAEAIRVSRYFGVHSYPDKDVKSLQDPRAYDQVFYYRQIHAALQAAGIKSGPFIITEIGLYNGWRGVTTDTKMAQDFVWAADQMNNDPYVLGMAVFGLFAPDRNEWKAFNIDGSNIPDIMGDYNTVH